MAQVSYFGFRKSLDVLAIASIFQDQNTKKGTSSHIVTKMSVWKLLLQELTLETMKDSGSFFIIILQRNVKEMSLADGVKSNRKPRTINGHCLQIYLEYVLFVFKTDSDSKDCQNDIQVLATDIGGIHFLLGRPWLHNIAPIIH